LSIVDRSVEPGCVVQVIAQHFEEAAHLASVRALQLSAANVRLRLLARLDERIAAHIDGLAIAGEEGWRQCQSGLEAASAGRAFAATLMALEAKNPERLNWLLALAAAVPAVLPGFQSGLGWATPASLRGIISGLLSSGEGFPRLLGVSACAMHRLDPGLISARRLQDPDPGVRARAWRTAGELGLRNLVSAAAASIADDDAEVRFWSAWSAVLLGDREQALEYLSQIAIEGMTNVHRPRAFQLCLQALEVSHAHALLRQLGTEPKERRLILQGAGWVGDPTYVPWLIRQMADDRLARLAGESFSLITGLDLAYLDLERKPPEVIEAGPNDDPEDSNVEMDPDEGLPWPDQDLVQAWWNRHGSGFRPGRRYFMGAPVAHQGCLDVLRNGFQRQRIAAAYHLALSEPGSVLFEWRAPARRQQQLLAGMS
jgi:uncharacterized protein (TIGR02270 family)